MVPYYSEAGRTGTTSWFFWKSNWCVRTKHNQDILYEYFSYIYFSRCETKSNKNFHCGITFTLVVVIQLPFSFLPLTISHMNSTSTTTLLAFVFPKKLGNTRYIGIIQLITNPFIQILRGYFLWFDIGWSGVQKKNILILIRSPMYS